MKSPTRFPPETLFPNLIFAKSSYKVSVPNPTVPVSVDTPVTFNSFNVAPAETTTELLNVEKPTGPTSIPP